MNKKFVIFSSVSIVLVIVIIISLSMFLPKNLISIKKSLKDLKVSDIAQIELERSPCCGPQEGHILNKIISNKDDINGIIKTLQEIKVKTDYKVYVGGLHYTIKIILENGKEITVKFNQGKVTGTRFRVQGDDLWDLLNSLLV